ncbi:MAG: NDP-sugar synthase [Acidobacteriota bacterium]
MKALVLATARLSDHPALDARRPACMLPLLDRPFLQHVVERLVALGATELEVLASWHAEAIEELIDDGSRWGVRARTQLVRGPDAAIDRLRVLADRSDDWCLLARADRLPQLSKLPDLHHAPDGPIPWTHAEGDEVVPSGWTLVPAGELARLPEGLTDAELDEWFLGRARVAGLLEPTGRPLTVSPLTALLSAQSSQLLTSVRKEWGLLITGREVSPGLQLGRGVEIHPDARIVAPAYIGESASIGAGAQVGPGTCIGAGSVVAAGARLRETLVLPESHVGEDVDLERSLVDGPAYLSVEQETAQTVTDSSLLSGRDLRGGILRALARRSVAILLLLIGSPVFLLAMLVRLLSGRSPWRRTRELVIQPAPPEPESWRMHRAWSFRAVDDGPAEGLSDLITRVLPGLLSVATGRLALFGVRPRSREELLALPESLRQVLLPTPAGLIDSGFVRHGVMGSADELRAAECLRAVRARGSGDLSLALGYLGRLTGWGVPSERP